jgi:peptide/nickel transport system substrate-binding protein
MKRLIAASCALLLICSCRGRNPKVLDSVAISVPYEVETLDPHARNALSSFALTLQLYEPLVSTNLDMQIEPCLARRWENPDPSTWVFHLEPSVFFHSGKPMRAEDVVYSFERIELNPTLEMGGYTIYIRSVRALDPTTVEIRTTGPLAVLLNKLRFIAIVPKGSNSKSLEEHPDGTGPYKVAEWKPQKFIRLVRNDSYWGKKPYLREAIFRLGRDPDEALSDLQTGQSRLAQINIKKARLEKSLAGRFRLQSRSNIFLKYLGFDLSREVTPFASVTPNPFRNRLVREAIDVAIDRSSLCADLESEAVPASQLVPPFVFGFDSKIPAAAFDRARARELLREAGLPAGFAATLHTRRAFAQAADLVARQLASVGIALKVEVFSDEDFYRAMDRRDSSLQLSRFGCITGDMSDILDNCLHSPDPARHFGIHNYGGYSDPAVDRAIEESAQNQALAARRDTLQQIGRKLMDDLVWVPLYIDEDTFAVDPRLSWQPRNDGMILAREISAGP